VTAVIVIQSKEYCMTLRNKTRKLKDNPRLNLLSIRLTAPERMRLNAMATEDGITPSELARERLASIINPTTVKVAS